MFVGNYALTHAKKLSCIPDDMTGLERIMLAAQGDLQRLLRYRNSLTRCFSVNRIYGVLISIARSSDDPST